MSKFKKLTSGFYYKNNDIISNSPSPLTFSISNCSRFKEKILALAKQVYKLNNKYDDGVNNISFYEYRNFEIHSKTGKSLGINFAIFHVEVDGFTVTGELGDEKTEFKTGWIQLK